MRTRRSTLIATLAFGAFAGCDPILSVDGAFFPAWLLCLLSAGVLLAIIRAIVRRSGIEPFIGPRVTVYICTYIACTLALWLGFFRT